MPSIRCGGFLVTHDEKIAEQAAKAAHLHDQLYYGWPSWDELKASERLMLLIKASSAIAAVRKADEAAGLVLVPKEPTEDMVRAGWIDKEDVNPDDIWCAMIEARPK